jgi:hypothetical protein
MEELVDVKSFIRELKELAEFQRTEIQNAIFSSTFSKPVYESGHLFREIGSYNTVSRMLRIDADNRVTISINAAPPSAFYGIFAITGTSTHKKYGIRDYPKVGLSDSEVQRDIKDIQDKIGEQANGAVREQVRTIFSGWPKKV